MTGWPDSWWAMCRSAALRADRPLGVTRLGRQWALWRSEGGAASCAPAGCPHRGADLALGAVRAGRLVCRYHGFEFGADGACLAIPCEGRDAKRPPGLRLRPVPVIEAHGFVFAYLGAGQATPLPWVPDAPAPSAAEGVRELVWPVPLGRTVEAMLDIHHLAFAHPVAGVPSYTRLEPFEAGFDADGVLRSEGRLRREDAPGTGLWFRMDVAPPGHLCLRLTEQVDVVVVCAPVDAQNTWLAMRYRVRVPVLGALPLVDRLASELAVMIELWLVQPDDVRMVGSAAARDFQPSDGQLVHADKAISAWYAWYARATKPPSPGDDRAARPLPPAGR